MALKSQLSKENYYLIAIGTLTVKQIDDIVVFATIFVCLLREAFSFAFGLSIAIAL